jgi:uncharacterized protein with PQ loop repeat
MQADWIGWASALVLIVTLGRQVFKQWRQGNEQGVSTWLFGGQVLASIGFSVYSYLLENWVFLATNLVLLVNALLGQYVTLSGRREGRSSVGP